VAVEPDEELISPVTGALEYLGAGDAKRVEAGYVVRMPKAYPVHDEHGVRDVDSGRDRIAEHHPNVSPVGRDGMQRYDNQVWSVNAEQEHHEVSDGPSRDRRRDASAPGTRSDAALLSRGAIERAASRREEAAT
jgi:protoporphyrinogen oxidase